jgi:hypothetical protein
VFGAPITLDGVTIITMARIGQISLTGGNGGAAGGAGGLHVEPVGVIEMNADGVHLRHDPSATRLILLLLVLVAWSVFSIAHAVRRRAAGQATDRPQA